MTSSAPPPKPRVLVVDDEPSVLRAVTRILQVSGFTVEGASDALTALDRVIREDFDVVVSDVSMPGLDGLALLERIRCHDADLPVVLMTGGAPARGDLGVTRFGALRCLEKPFEPDALERTILEAARIRNLARARQSLAESLELDTDPVGLVERRVNGDFDAALAKLWMAYQPIVDREGNTFGWEALMRSTHAGLEQPVALLDAAERAGRMQELGRKVRATAPAGMSSIPPDACLCINLHPSELDDPELFAKSGPLADHANRIVLEITERAALDTVSDIESKVEQLRTAGYRIALDDLGAGYAGLAGFAALSPDLVKLDMALVRNIDESGARQRLARTLVGLCRDLGMTVVAEGVETPSERDTLLGLGCDLLQGFLFARPSHPPPLAAW